METESTVSEYSAAIVSVYNSWSTTSESISFYDSDDTLLLDGDDHRYSSLPEPEPVDTEELLKELKNRCRSEDIPHNPELRIRRRPVCQFRNFIGTRQYHKRRVRSTPTYVHPPLMVFELPFGSHDLDLGLEEKDALFPLCSSKAKHSNYDGPETKKARLDAGTDATVGTERPLTLLAAEERGVEDQVMGSA
jgi:hypothetical protein